MVRVQAPADGAVASMYGHSGGRPIRLTLAYAVADDCRMLAVLVDDSSGPISPDREAADGIAAMFGLRGPPKVEPDRLTYVGPVETARGDA